MKVIKKNLQIILLVTITLFFNEVVSNAALQSNKNSVSSNNFNTWIVNIRKMESIGGGMGFKEYFDANTLLPTTASNNVDIHMEKNSEYGAMAILSASSYGNPSKIESGGTTTGNKSGIVINLTGERVAGGCIYDSAIWKSANARYKSMYTGSYVAKLGDAISETAGWHGGVTTNWMGSVAGSGGDRFVGLIRAGGGSVFSYHAYGSTEKGYSAYYGSSYPSRAAMICGEGV